jgi:hypothetical protein
MYLFNRLCSLWYRLTPRKIRRFWLATALHEGHKQGWLTMNDDVYRKALNELKGNVHPSWLPETID